MYSIRLSGRVELSKIEVSKLGTIAKTSAVKVIIEASSMLTTVIDVEVAKTNTTFLAVYQDTC